MKKLLLAAAALLLSAPAWMGQACSFFAIARDGVVFAANNEDYLDPDTKVWFEPGEEGEYGRMYFGFFNGFPQGGMNEAGLFFDGAATKEKLITKGLGGKPYEGNPVDELMACCGTVEEAIDFLREWNLAPLLTKAQLQFADANGDSAIIEGDEVVWKEDDFQITTNFYQSEVPQGRPCPCPRYRSLKTQLAACGTPTVDKLRKIMASVHQEGEVSTVYSTIYDLQNQKAWVYHFHDYENVVVLDLKEELAKGAHEFILADIFPKTFAYQTFKQRYAARQKK